MGTHGFYNAPALGGATVGGPAQHERLPPTHKASPLGQAHILLKGLGELGGEHGGRVTHRIGDGVKVAAVVAVGDPFSLTVREAGGRREAHRSGLVELREL